MSARLPTAGLLALVVALAACASEPDVPEEPDPPVDGCYACWQTGSERLHASVAELPLFAPLGISTAGYSQAPEDDAPKSPFAGSFQATTTVLHPPRVQVIHLLRGDQRILLVQTDLIGIHQRLYRQVAAMVQERTGYDSRRSMLLLANHTHSGPGRMFKAAFADIVADVYDEQIATLIAGRIADAIESALTAKATPATLGWTLASNTEMHRDRRCENPEHRNDTMGILRIDGPMWGPLPSKDTLAVVMVYAMHGTVFSPGDGMLSGDAPRAVEIKVAEALPDAAMVMFVQSWAGDMSPKNPFHSHGDSAYEVPFHKRLDQLEALGRSAANTVLAAWDDMTWPDLSAKDAFATDMVEVPIDRKVLGYAEDEFKFEHGAAFCGLSKSKCDGGDVPNMKGCVPLPAGGGPTQVRVGGVRLGGLALLALPGEPATSLAEYGMKRLQDEAPAVKATMVLGYAQDYTGYLLLPDDWNAGGYEAAMNYWGPKQGTWLADGAAAVVARLFGAAMTLGFEPAEELPYEAGEGGAYAPVVSAGHGAVVSDLPTTAKAGAELTMSWTGGDPWVDEPTTNLERRAKGKWLQVSAGAVVVDQRNYRIALRVQPDPPWTQPAAVQFAQDVRTFTWSAVLRTGLRVKGPLRALDGLYRLRIQGRAVAKDGQTVDYTVTSGAVDIAPIFTP